MCVLLLQNGMYVYLQAKINEAEQERRGEKMVTQHQNHSNHLHAHVYVTDQLTTAGPF